MRLLFSIILIGLCTSTFSQDDLRYGKIKVRKPKPVDFYVEIDHTPDYATGNLEDDIYDHLNFPHEADLDQAIVVMSLIIDQYGRVVWVEAEDDPESLFALEAKRVLSTFVGNFSPHTLDGRAVPASFDIPIKFKR